MKYQSISAQKIDSLEETMVDLVITMKVLIEAMDTLGDSINDLNENMEKVLDE